MRCGQLKNMHPGFNTDTHRHTHTIAAKLDHQQQSQKACWHIQPHIVIWAVHGLAVCQVAGAGSNYRNPGACTFEGLFLHGRQRDFEDALPARGKAGRAGRHYIAIAGKK